MSYRLVDRVMDLHLPDEQERVLLRLARHASDDGTRCYPGVDRLAADCGRTERSVQRILRLLEQANLIQSIPGFVGGRGHTKEWRLTLDAAQKDDTVVTLSLERVTRMTPILPWKGCHQ